MTTTALRGVDLVVSSAKALWRQVLVVLEEMRETQEDRAMNFQNNAMNIGIMMLTNGQMPTTAIKGSDRMSGRMSAGLILKLT
jgi:hypothetical protein